MYKRIDALSDDNTGISFVPAVYNGLFCIVNPDYEQVWDNVEFEYYKNVSRPTRNGIAYGAVSGIGLPATARFVDDTPVKFVKELQFWVHDICSRNAAISEQEKRNSFRSLWRDNAWMSNFAGSITRADYINNNGMPPEIQLQPMATGGALLKITGETYIRGRACYLIEAINPLYFTGYDPDTTPWLFFRPTLSVRRWIFDDKNNVIKKEEHYNEPFPQYAEESIVPVFGFIKNSASGTGYANAIEKSRVRVLQKNEFIPNPFIIRDRVKKNPYS